MNFDGVFGRSDIMEITSISITAAGNLLNILKNAGLIEAVRGYGNGKYKFVAPKWKKLMLVISHTADNGQFLIIYKFSQHNFLRTVVNTVFTAYPFHLVSRFQDFCHALLTISAAHFK